MRILLILPLIAVLVGCQTAQTNMASDDTKCQSYGVAPGTPGYVQCRMNLDQQHADQRALNSTSPIGMIANTLQGR